MTDRLVTQSIDLPGGPLTVLQPEEVADAPDTHGVEWAPIAPYWAVLWRSGVTLAREVAAMDLSGQRVVELGCGLAAPSLAAARAGAAVLATDTSPEALALVARNAEANGVTVESATADWSDPDALADQAPFDLVLASDVVYEEATVHHMLALLPRLTRRCLLADPGRPSGAVFLELARDRWTVHSQRRGLVDIHDIRLSG